SLPRRPAIPFWPMTTLTTTQERAVRPVMDRRLEVTARADLPRTATGVEPRLEAGEAERALDAAVRALFRKLRPTPDERAGAGTGRGLHWCAELEGDSILSSEYLLMKWILG